MEDLSELHRQLSTPAPDAKAWTQADLVVASGRPKSKVQLALHLLRQQGLVYGDADGRIRLANPSTPHPPDDAAWQAMLQAYAQRKRRDRDMLESMVFYCQSGQCRWKMLLAHFEQAEGFGRCGQCDNCIRMRRAEDQAREDDAARALASSEHTAEGDKSCAVELRVGDAVRVPRYGRGRVSAVDGEGVTVQFPNGPERCFLPEYVRPARHGACQHAC